jgi:ribonucleases P/MRP protein subunit RPP40
MDKGIQVDVVYTDFEKAFDRVDHVILLHKLLCLGIHGDLLRWIQSSLSNSSQAVVLGGFRSDFVSIPSGVPQGSHLGPLFYSAYIFDIGKHINHSNYILYADDKKIYRCIRNTNDSTLLQQDLDLLYNYYHLNNITISVGKCQCISFTRKKKPIIHTYNFNGAVIERVNVVRDLGVLLDSEMSMRDHINAISSRAFRNLGFVMRTCRPFRSVLCLKAKLFSVGGC